MQLTRRAFIQGMAIAGALPLIPGIANAMAPGAAEQACATQKMLFSKGPKDRTLSLIELHTGESGTFHYMRNGQYVPEEVARLTHLLRDHYNGKTHAIDRHLFDLLFQIKEVTGTEKPIEIISAYRSPETNAMLQGRNRVSGVASGSYHIKGQAIDICLGDVRLKTLHDKALAIKAGGVGYYPSSGFVHVDTGPVRRWG